MTIDAINLNLHVESTYMTASFPLEGRKGP